MFEATLILLSILVGAFFQRVVGFGMPIIVFPVTLIFFKPTSALTIALMVGIVASIGVIYQLKAKTHLDFKIIKLIIPMSIIGIVVGAYTLTVISKEALQIFLGLSVIVSLSIQRYFLPKPKEKIKTDKKLQAYGLLAGFFNSTVGLSAAPLLIWSRSYIVKPDQIRIIMAYSFVIMNSISILVIQLLENNTLPSVPVYIFVCILPVILLSNYLGAITAKKVDKSFYDQFAYSVLMFTGIVTFFSGLI